MENGKSEILSVARRLVGYAKERERKVSEKEVNLLWEEVELRAEAGRKSLLRKRIRMTIIASTAAAACICAVVVGSRMNADNPGEPLAELAKCAEARDGVGSKTLLVMPGMNGIEIDEQDADIIWSDNGTVSVNTISINQPSDEGFSKIIVPKGKRARLTLADGTHLWVNSGSRVIFPGSFAENHREIYVEGEVYMDVFHNESSPFTVQSGNFRVKVLGTSFNISAYPGENRSSVVLVGGKVNIADESGNEVQMAPGQIVKVKNGNIGAPEKVDVEPYVSWVRNTLVCRNESLETVFRKLNLAYDREFVLGPGVSALEVSGKLNLKDSLEDVLHTISFAAPIYYENSEGKIYVYKD